MVPGARETVSVDSVASGRRSAPYPPFRLSPAKGLPRTFSCPDSPLPAPVRPLVRPPTSPLQGPAQRTLLNQQTRIARGKSEPGLRQRL